MTNPSANHLGKAKIRRLLAAVGTTPVQEQTPENVAVYDWRDPHYLNADQLNRLAAVMSQVAARLADVFTRFFSREFDVAPTAVTQHFAGDLLRSISPANDYCLTFGPDKGPPCGFLAISSRTTTTWAGNLLGDTESAADSDRPLSSLEESLLSDLVATVLEVFLASLRPHQTLKGIGRFNRGQPESRFETTDAICRISFRIGEAGKDDPSDITFLLSCDRLDALVGKTPAATTARPAPQELSQMLMEHLQQIPVTVTARLASTPIEFQEILDLAPGDVLLLDKPIHEMVELTIEGRTAFRGRPVRSEGNYAILIRESRTGPMPQTKNTNSPGGSKKG